MQTSNATPTYQKRAPATVVGAAVGERKGLLKNRPTAHFSCEPQACHLPFQMSSQILSFLFILCFITTAASMALNDGYTSVQAASTLARIVETSTTRSIRTIIPLATTISFAKSTSVPPLERPPPFDGTAIGLGSVVPICAFGITFGAIAWRIYRNRQEREWVQMERSRPAELEANEVLEANDIPIQLDMVDDRQELDGRPKKEWSI